MTSEILQLLISGISQGCVYGLIALGFVLIYKATEMVNFAQGELLMVGAFVGYTFANTLHWPFATAFVATLAVMAVVGVVHSMAGFAITSTKREPRYARGLLGANAGLWSVLSLSPFVASEVEYRAILSPQDGWVTLHRAAQMKKPVRGRFTPNPRVPVGLPVRTRNW